jgi:hypothetical protein
MHRFLEGAKVALFFPFIQIYNLCLYANTRDGWVAKIATFIIFIPIMVITTTVWAGAWALLLSLCRYIIGK